MSPSKCRFGLPFRLAGGVGAPEEGELFLANPIVKNFHIHRNLFLLDDHKVLLRKSGEEGTAFGGPLVSPQAGSPHAVPLRDGNGTLGGRQDRCQAEGPLLLVRVVEGR